MPDIEPQVIFGRNLKAARAERAVSQREVAAKADMSTSRYSRLERGEVEPTFTTIVSLADALDIDPGTLVRGI